VRDSLRCQSKSLPGTEYSLANAWRTEGEPRRTFQAIGAKDGGCIRVSVFSPQPGTPWGLPLWLVPQGLLPVSLHPPWHMSAVLWAPPVLMDTWGWSSQLSFSWLPSWCKRIPRLPAQWYGHRGHHGEQGKGPGDWQVTCRSPDTTRVAVEAEEGPRIGKDQVSQPDHCRQPAPLFITVVICGGDKR
jgi:hypothetical protein